MKSRNKLISLLYLTGFLPLICGCDNRIGITVESAYTEVVWKEPTYKFQRNQHSSVQSHEIEQLAKAVERIHASYLKRPDFQYPYRYKDMMDIYTNGLQSTSPMEMIASSPVHRNSRTPIRTDIQAILDGIAKEAGPNHSGDMSLKHRSAAPGLPGYVGLNVGDDNAFYVDAKGRDYAGLFKIYMVGAIYLDQILNQLLQPSLYDDQKHRRAHQNVELMPGGNYTFLEHQWDLAYAYYQHCRFITTSNGFSLLKDSHQKIHYAFVQGRIDLGILDYKDLQKQLNTIRLELSKAVAAKAIFMLLGPNTISNLDDEMQYAFTNLTEGYALLYALQFTIGENGISPYTYEEVVALQAKLSEGNGFWEKEKLVPSTTNDGSTLRIVAKEVAQKYRLNIDNFLK